MVLDFAVPEAHVTVVADVTPAEQAITNAISSAVRYYKAGGHVAVLLEAQPGAPVRVRIIDDGPGIAPGAVAAITARFSRGNMARSRAPRGQGLGAA